MKRAPYPPECGPKAQRLAEKAWRELPDKMKRVRTFKLGDVELSTNVEGFDPTILKRMTPEELRVIVEGDPNDPE